MKLWIIPLALALTACNRGAPQTPDAVRLGVIEHLRDKAGLDIGSMDIQIASVSFRGTEADALVAFRPKGSPDPGMRMKYTLESQRGKWVVKGRSEGGAPHSGAPEGSPKPGGDLPAGHPPVGQPQSGSSSLPPDHPPVGSSGQKK